MWTTSATAHTAATASHVWAIYRDVAGWPRWDQGIARSQLDGPFTVGTAGTLQPVGGPEFPFALILVEERCRFADSTPVGPETTIVVRHELTPLAAGTQITHIIEVDGPDAEQLAQALDLAEGVREAVSTLGRYAEEDQP
jgi:Polyketide cyclase / dehydrase and lipid transport